MRYVLIAATAVALAGCASSAPVLPGSQTNVDDGLRVVEADARIALAGSSIDSFSAGPGQSMLIMTRGGGIYRVMLQPPCRGEAGFSENAAIEPTGTDTVDKFSKIRLNGRVCSVASIDRVERIRPS